MVKVVRTDRELECPVIDAGLRAMGLDLVLVPDGAGENVLLDAVADAELILMCYTPITERVIAAAPRLKGIVKYGVGIDAICGICAISGRMQRVAWCEVAARRVDARERLRLREVPVVEGEVVGLALVVPEEGDAVVQVVLLVRCVPLARGGQRVVDVPLLGVA